MERQQKARAETAALQAALQQLGPVMMASMTRRRYRCGQPNCHCAVGELHEDYVVTRKVDGRTQTVRVRRGQEESVREWVENWRRQKALLRQLAASQMELIRSEAVL